MRTDVLKLMTGSEPGVCAGWHVRHSVMKTRSRTWTCWEQGSRRPNFLAKSPPSRSLVNHDVIYGNCSVGFCEHGICEMKCGSARCRRRCRKYTKRLRRARCARCWYARDKEETYWAHVQTCEKLPYTCAFCSSCTSGTILNVALREREYSSVCVNESAVRSRARRSNEAALSNSRSRPVTSKVRTIVGNAEPVQRTWAPIRTPGSYFNYWLITDLLLILNNLLYVPRPLLICLAMPICPYVSRLARHDLRSRQRSSPKPPLSCYCCRYRRFSDFFFVLKKKSGKAIDEVNALWKAKRAWRINKTQSAKSCQLAAVTGFPSKIKPS